MTPTKTKPALVCLKCNVALEPRKASFNYLGFTFNTELPRCPVCGQVFLSEELVKGKVAEVEMSLEDK
ncbi:DVU_1557 family redox protein [Sporomusa acidovorans]|uniref:DUF7479 domain-containing protein n=1 Tax=Sporomusa acidovorans (strain ATCC 49682 / DSM 3132 / Mol) TaxID=1123286 RepID=A0ABZ3J0N8_SPOA4|nr:CLJU_RS11820 family redox protein [Sporomusa acidovorans]OZC21323.1 hypothetical protein SPACI_19500 [Sporomusa acidovorans DSM 3132]SDE57366.1 hypothetical protein SAMN04488499_101689 [Sporomusa acidovorans]